MVDTNVSSSNIHLAWLDNILQQIKSIQTMERISREGCEELAEYMQIPIQYRPVIMPDAQYKNVRFIILELDMLLVNVQGIIDETKVGQYKTRLRPLLDSIDDRRLFLKEIYSDGKLIRIDILPLLLSAIRHIVDIKSSLIKDLSPLLYLKEDKKKTW